MDPYALCPCGSGKKVKFCCQPIVAEMEKVEKFQENNQPRMALQLLEKLAKSHPTNPWVITRQGINLINDGRAPDAKTTLVAFLRNRPDHPLANALYAMATVSVDGLPAAKKAVHRAFKFSIAAEPHLCAILAGSMADHYFEAGSVMAARQYLAMALRLGMGEARQQALVELLELDSDPLIPYPLRSGQTIPNYQGTDATKEAVLKAQRLSSVGCYEEAAQLLTDASAQDAESAELWHWIALLRAWDGHDAAAAEAFQKASGLYKDFQLAAECATIAQLLERFRPESSVAVRQVGYRIESVSRLLGKLDELPELDRVRSPRGASEDGSAAAYMVLDRPMPTPSGDAPVTVDQVPRVLGRIHLYDAVDNDQADEEERGPRAILSGIEGSNLEKIQSLFQAATGGQATELPVPADAPDGNVVARVPKDDAALFVDLRWPTTLSIRVARQLQKDYVRQLIFDLWPNSPRAALGGKTPREAASVPDLKVALAASVHYLDAMCDLRGIVLPVDELRSQLGLERPEPQTLEDASQLNVLSALQIQRVPLGGLGNEHLDPVMQRFLTLRHSRLAAQVLQEALEGRSDFYAEPKDRGTAIARLSDILRIAGDIEGALRWNQMGFEESQKTETAVVDGVQWKIREVIIRGNDKDDPALRNLLVELWEVYGPKLPRLRELLQNMVKEAGIDPPWESAILTAGSDAVWSPSTAAAPAGAGSKLWVPE